MNWLKKNWMWLALGGGVVYFLTRSKSASAGQVAAVSVEDRLLAVASMACKNVRNVTRSGDTLHVELGDGTIQIDSNTVANSTPEQLATMAKLWC